IESGGGGAWETFRHHIKRFEHPSLKLEGKGKHSRHVKFRALDDIDTEAVRWLLAEALKRVSNG
ncbi:MAG: hypothetical protein IH820_15655, partial [Bacteroidetes bacterium]|nr:hypothetical protein [Bacteroidota bacterium]